MDISFSPKDERFKEEVVEFLEAAWPQSVHGHFPYGRGLEYSRDNYLPWHKKLHEKGWAAPAWPKEYGGTGWTPAQRYIFDMELARVGAFPVIPFNITMVGPVIYTFGSDEQKKRFLPPTLAADIWWCQGYSEPGAGSDLANVKTRAIRDGDDYIVNGSKIWTTLAQYADWIFCLVRTDPNAKQQKGISFLLIDMKTPGVTVRPIITLGGQHEVNEVFFDNVRVPAGNLIGEENRGWTYAKFLLTHERSGIAPAHISRRNLESLKEMATDEAYRRAGRLLIDDPTIKLEIAEIEAELWALEYTELRGLASEMSGKGPGAESSITKVRGTEIQQRITHLASRLAGPHAMPFQRNLGHNEYVSGPEQLATATAQYFNFRKASIYGGTNEIQRNIIAKGILGL